MEAKYLLALSDIELGRTRDGLATLATLYEKLPAEAPAAAVRAADAALAAGAEADAVRWLATLADSQDGEARARTLARAPTRWTRSASRTPRPCAARSPRARRCRSRSR